MEEHSRPVQEAVRRIVRHLDAEVIGSDEKGIYLRVPIGRTKKSVDVQVWAERKFGRVCYGYAKITVTLSNAERSMIDGALYRAVSNVNKEFL